MTAANSGTKVALTILAAVAVSFAAYQASSVFAPLVLALFIIAIVWPLQEWLQSRLPMLIALAITLIVVVAVGLAFASLVVWGFGRVGRAVMNDAGRDRGARQQPRDPAPDMASRSPGCGPSISTSAGSYARRNASPAASIRRWPSGSSL